jgi:hypothetical protein
LPFDSDKKIDFYDSQGNYVEPIEEKIPEGHTAEIVIGDYLDALGGKDKIENIKDMSSVYSAEIMGRNAIFTTLMKSPSMMLKSVNVGKMTMQKQVFDGKVLKMSGMAGSSEADSGPEFELAKEGTVVVGQLMYSNDGYSIKLDGISKIAGRPHYVVIVNKPGDSSVTEYYDTETNLLTRSVETAEANGQTITVSSDFQDYEEVNGVKFPSKVSLTGMMPEVVVLMKKEISLNTGLSDDDFK